MRTDQNSTCQRWLLPLPNFSLGRLSAQSPADRRLSVYPATKYFHRVEGDPADHATGLSFTQFMQGLAPSLAYNLR